MKKSSSILLAAVLTVAALGCSKSGVDGEYYRYVTKKATDSAGTGRFYFGREIAAVTAHAGGAEWMEKRDRDNAELPDRLVANLDLKPTDAVADIGAGTGYLTFRIADEVPYGRVYAVDIQPEMLSAISDIVDSLSVTNVHPVLGSAKSPNLPVNSTNVAVMVASYHEFFYPWEMMHSIFDSLKPGGRLILIEYRGEDETIELSPLHKLTRDQARKEMEAIGFTLKASREILPQQHFLEFQKPFE